MPSMPHLDSEIMSCGFSYLPSVCGFVKAVEHNIHFPLSFSYSLFSCQHVCCLHKLSCHILYKLFCNAKISIIKTDFIAFNCHASPQHYVVSDNLFETVECTYFTQKNVKDFFFFFTICSVMSFFSPFIVLCTFLISLVSSPFFHHLVHFCTLIFHSVFFYSRFLLSLHLQKYSHNVSLNSASQKRFQ